MATSFPRMQTYLEGLPCGLDSYPECLQKASVIRNFFKDVVLQQLLDRLDPSLATLLRHPPPASSWIPEVHATAIYMAAADCLFPGPLFVKRAYTTNYALLDSTMYRLLFRAAGTRRLIIKAVDTWALFHRGTTLAVDILDEVNKTCDLVINSPSNHIPSLLAEGYGTAFRAALEIKGLQNVRSRVEKCHERLVHINVSWKD